MDDPADSKLLHGPLTQGIIGAAIEVHRTVGPGLLESVYEELLCYELELRAIPYQRQVHLPVAYKGRRLRKSFRIDVLVDDLVVVEVKAVAQLASVDEAILRTYLRFSGKRVGLIINFNVPALPQGIVRRVL